ncbi:MAG: cytochrome c biogenesis CcdA family protein [Ktedonobacterales bacterium]
MTLLGAAAAFLGSAVSVYQQVLERIVGLLLIFFGVALTDLLPIPWLSRDYHIPVKPGPSAWWRSALLGLTFGASWSACSSPILGSILVLTAARSLLLAQAVIIMLAFALGQGVPLLLVGFLIDRASTFLRRIRRYTARLSQVGGVILILLGIVLLTGLFSTTG